MIISRYLDRRGEQWKVRESSQSRETFNEMLERLVMIIINVNYVQSCSVGKCATEEQGGSRDKSSWKILLGNLIFNVLFRGK